MARITKKVKGKEITIFLEIIKHIGLDEEGKEVSIEDPVREVRIIDEGKNKTFYYGTFECKSDYAIIFGRAGDKKHIHTVTDIVMETMLNDYIKNRETIDWEEA